MTNKIIVAGFSPRIADVPEEIYSNHKVVGINDFPRFRVPDYWICVDTNFYEKQKRDVLRWTEGIPRYAEETTGAVYGKPQFDCIPYKGNAACQISREWTGFLRFTTLTATAACSLAYHLGADEIYLVGVDCCGIRYDDSPYDVPNYWDTIVPNLNKFFKMWPQDVCPIYKTYHPSPLDLPFRDPKDLLVTS